MTTNLLWLIVALLGVVALLVTLGLNILRFLLLDDGWALFRIRYLRYYRVGDLVTLADQHGRVTAIDLFTTTLLTPAADRVTLSNRTVLSSAIVCHANQQALAAIQSEGGHQSEAAQPRPNPQWPNDQLIDSSRLEMHPKRTEEVTTANLPPTMPDVKQTGQQPEPVAAEEQNATMLALLDPVNQAVEQTGETADLPLSPPVFQARALALATVQPLTSRPQLGGKSLGILRSGMIPAMRKEKVIATLPVDKSQETNIPTPPAQGRQWRFAPTTWRVGGAKRK